MVSTAIIHMIAFSGDCTLSQFKKKKDFLRASKTVTCTRKYTHVRRRSDELSESVRKSKSQHIFEDMAITKKIYVKINRSSPTAHVDERENYAVASLHYRIKRTSSVPS